MPCSNNIFCSSADKLFGICISEMSTQSFQRHHPLRWGGWLFSHSKWIHFLNVFEWQTVHMCIQTCALTPREQNKILTHLRMLRWITFGNGCFFLRSSRHQQMLARAETYFFGFAWRNDSLKAMNQKIIGEYIASTEMISLLVKMHCASK